MKQLIFSALGLFFFSNVVLAQDITMPVASPRSTVTQQFSTSKITVDYSRPAKNGRKVFGDVVAMDQTWRTGANKITTITFEEEVSFGGQKIPAGKYGLYTIPSAQEWTVLLNKNAEASSVAAFKDEENVAKVSVKPTVQNTVVENFTIDINSITNTTAKLNLMWDNLLVSVDIKADNHGRIMEYLTNALKGANPPYREAAFYFYEHDHRLEEVVKFADILLEKRPDAFWLYNLKANTFKKLGKKDLAIQMMEKAVDLTKGTGFEAEYAKKMEEIKK